MVSSDVQRLRHIRRYCEDVEGYLKRFGDFENFKNDRAYYSAVCMAILQIGELANGLSDEFRDETKERAPWALIRGMRNWVAHAYNELDEEIIWDTACNSMPTLRRFCDDALLGHDEKSL